MEKPLNQNGSHFALIQSRADLATAVLLVVKDVPPGEQLVILSSALAVAIRDISPDETERMSLVATCAQGISDTLVPVRNVQLGSEVLQ